MAKKKETSQKINENNVINQNITDTLELNYMPYAMSVIISRAIPEIDGFKPSHRKLLYTMYKMGLLKGNRIKSADVVGQTMRLNPHGDGAIYETLVRLTRGNDAILHPFIDSKGNFGKQYSRDMAYAASRYTEVKLDDICNEIFKDIDKNTVDFIDNYNGSTQEPVLFPTTFPNLLVTPNKGIAVGMASSICSFNLKEVCDTTIKFIKNKDIDLLKYLKAPDFSTGGELIYSKEEIQKIYDTGRGSFKIRGKYTFDKKNSCIEISEIPYTTTVEVIIDKIIALVKNNSLRDINDVRDETDLNGLKIAIDIKKSADPDQIMQKIFKNTTLSDSYNCNFNILINGKPRTLGVRDILNEWILFRMDCLSRQIKYDIDKKMDKLHLLEGLAKILLDIDKAIKIIRETEQDKKVIPNLISGFKIKEIQAEYIAEIKLRNLNKEYLLNRINERDSLQKEIDNLHFLLETPGEIENLICEQLKTISKSYGKPRKTDIIYEESVEEYSEESYIDDYTCNLFLTDHNYLKKISTASLRSFAEQSLKDDDFIIQELEITNKSQILMFSNKQNLYKIKGYDLQDCKASSMGSYLNNVLAMEEDEKILYICTVDLYEGYMVFVFDNGKIAKVNMKNYETKTNRKKIIKAFSDKGNLVFAKYITEDVDLLAIRDRDKATLINTGLIACKESKNANGVSFFTLKKGSLVSDVRMISEVVCNDIEFYRNTKIPSSGHFLQDVDKENMFR